MQDGRQGNSVPLRLAFSPSPLHKVSSFANLDMLQCLSSSLHLGPLSTIYQLGPSWHMYLDGDGSSDILLHRALHLKAVHSSLHQVGAQLRDCNDCKWKWNIWKNSQLPKKSPDTNKNANEDWKTPSSEILKSIEGLQHSWREDFGEWQGFEGHGNEDVNTTHAHTHTHTTGELSMFITAKNSLISESTSLPYVFHESHPWGS